MKSDELPKKNYFQHDAELTIDGTPYKKENYLLKSYVIGPLIFMTLSCWISTSPLLHEVIFRSKNSLFFF